MPDNSPPAYQAWPDTLSIDGDPELSVMIALRSVMETLPLLVAGEDLRDYLPPENKRMIQQINKELTSIRTSLGKRFDPGLPKRLSNEVKAARGFGK